MSKKLLQTVCLDSYRPRKDKSFTLTFSTNELSAKEVTDINELHGKMGILYFADKEAVSSEELTALDEIDIEIGNKSKSQLLRNVLFVRHQQDGGDSSNFKEYYARRMDAFINNEKSKLDKS